MAMYYNGKKVRNLYYNGKCITRLALGKEMTRLVEGDDFVRAKWLKGDGTAYINTNITTVNHIKFTVDTSGTADWITVAYTHTTKEYAIALQKNQIYAYFIGTSPNPLSVNVDGNRREYTIDIDCINGVLSVPETGQSGSKQFTTSFSYTHKFKPFQGVGLKDVFLDSMHLVPCRLLRPIPAALDGNGIARNAGECGMYNLVNGLFYGNVGSGAFTVEPSLVEGVDYERHKWLVGDGSAYINTLITSYSGIIKIAFKSAESVRCAIFGREALKSDFTDRLVLLLFPNGENKDISALYGTAKVSYALEITDLNDEEITIDLDNQIMTNKSGNSIHINVEVNVTGSSVILFGKGYGESIVNTIAPSDVAIKKFSANQINLVPVRLLRPLPSYLDANGKARKQFECGMLDLKTMKFYGNVAATGKFTVSDN